MAKLEKNKSRLVNLLTSLANAQIDQGNYTEAIKYYEKILMLGIEDVIVYSSLSRAFMKLNRFDTKALNIYRKTLQLDPENKEVLDLLSHYYLKENRFDDEAVTVFTQALLVRSVLSEKLLHVLVHYYSEKEAFVPAIELCEKCLNFPEIKVDALKYFVDLSIRALRFTPAIEVLTQYSRRTQDFNFLKALGQVIFEQQARFTHPDQKNILNEDELELVTQLLRADHLIYHWEEALMFNTLALIAMSARQFIPQNKDIKNKEYAFFFTELKPEAVLKSGFKDDYGAEVFEDDFWKQIWQRLGEPVSITSDQVKALDSPGNNIAMTRLEIGVALKVSNLARLKQEHGETKGSLIVSKFINKCRKQFEKNQPVQMRCLRDGFIGLAFFDDTVLLQTVNLLREIQATQAGIIENERCLVTVSLHRFNFKADVPASSFTDFNALLQLNDLKLVEKLLAEQQPEENFNIQSPFLISESIRNLAGKDESISYNSLGKIALPYYPDLLTVYQVDWIDPKERFKINILKKLPRFEILNELAVNDVFAVYKGRDNLLERLVVIKAIRKSRLSREVLQGDILSRYQKQAREMSRLNHRNIIMIYDVGENDDFIYLAREYYDGKSLKTLFEEKSFRDTNYLVRIFIQICSALKYAHQVGIFHNNLKPANIIVAGNDEVKVTDFGSVGFQLGQLIYGESQPARLNYQPPEQPNEKSLDNRADIFGVGKMLFEALTGDRLLADFQVGDTELKDIIKLSTTINPTVATAFDRIIQKSTATNPAARYPNMQSLMRSFYGATNGDLFKVLV